MAKTKPGRDGGFALETALTRLGRDPHGYSGFVNMPIFRGSTVLFPDAESLDSRDVPYTYGRPTNPTSRALESAMAAFEGAERAFLTPSGLSAVSTVLLTYAEKGGEILIADAVYGPTRRFAQRVLKRAGIDVIYYDPLIGDGIARLITDETKLIFTESPGSQTFEVQDIPAICEAARSAGIPVAMDNTWATPLYFRAFDHGVNISIQSATKYICGHADALLGTIACDGGTAEMIGATHEALGLCVSGEDCFLALRGLRTLAVRLKRHAQSGLAIAEWLQERPEVDAVLHPALPGAPGHGLWKRDFQGTTGLFSIVLKPHYTKASVRAMLNALSIFGMGYSWGGFESLIVSFDCSGYRTATRWPHPGIALRLSIGLEDPGDLKADLAHGLAKLQGEA